MNMCKPKTRIRWLTVLSLVVLVVAAAAPAAADGSSEPAYVIQLEENGDARVTVTMTFDLETDDERDAFRTLENDADARNDARDRFAERLSSVAADASEATGRDMTVQDASIDVSTDDDGNVGLVTLSVAWTNLAAQQDGRLVVTEPFASGFESDRPFTVRGPDGHRLDGASPSPDDEETNAATWDAGADLSGFEATFAPAEDSGTSVTNTGDDRGNTDVDVPGFGLVAMLVALVGVAALATRQH